MADILMLALTRPEGAEQASAITHQFTLKTDVKVGGLVALTPSPDADREVFFEFGERMRFDIAVCFGETWRYFDDQLQEPLGDLEIGVITMLGHHIPTIVITAPPATSPWWFTVENVSAFYDMCTYAVTNRILALKSNLLTLKAEAHAWN